MRLKLALALLVTLALPVMAQDKKVLQGNWLGWGCYADTHKTFAISYSVSGDTTTLHELMDDKGRYPMEGTGPATYEVHDGKVGVISVIKGSGFRIVLHESTVAGDDGTYGSLDNLFVTYSHGSSSDLPMFYDAYADFCKE